MSLKCIAMSLFVVTGSQWFRFSAKEKTISAKRAYFLSAFFEKRVTVSEADLREHGTPLCG